ncbi:GntR family transcriptional regulator [Cryptosporangium phraense]|uniref:GntR family transcriptional regulator n=1 Tax=Cryptosporangium phraense TaxID=2593070 RepID=A0A545AXH1_9ACTN|nr:GntR family transcriptional regulator [Cryptosporangium phraense]TQS45981.1 GntR family transcriptional regulator [Cryptosporangium phraense]
MQPPITLDRSSPVPLYFQVAEQLEQAILSGTLGAGDRIGNEVAMAADLGLSRPTMRQAIQVLVDKGLLVRKRGVGTQVVQGRVHRPLELTSLFDDLTKAGQQPRTVVLKLELVEPDDHVRAELRLSDHEQAWYLERLRSVGSDPLAHMTNYLPTDVVDLAAVDLGEVGLYQAMRRAGVVMRVARQRISARRADAAEARLLGEVEGAPVLTMDRTTYDDAGRAVEYGTHAYRPDRYAFESTLVDR